jgi:hypothetical protein
MTGERVEVKSGVLETADGAPGMPALIVHAGAEKRFLGL